MDLDQFAAERDVLLVDIQGLLAPAVQEALDENDLNLLAEAAREAMIMFYTEEHGESGRDAAVAQFMEDMLPALTKTVPEEDTGRQTERISTWIATAVVGATAAFDPSRGPKTWVTMRDDDVRDVHAPMEGATVAYDETFSIKTDPVANLLYPGQPVGPFEAWINCRCVLAIGNIVASAAPDEFGSHDLIFYENRRTPEVVAKGAKGTRGGAGTKAGKVIKRRAATKDEEKKIANGDWVRVEPGGKTPNDAGYKDAKKSKVRPQHNSLAYDVTMAADEENIEDEELDGTEPPIPNEPISAEDSNQPVYGVAVPEGVESGDKRMFAPGGITHRDLPLPLTWQRAAIGEHDGEVVVGRLDTLDLRADGMWHYTGELLTDIPETEEVINLIAQGALRGVSIAGDKGKVSQPTDEELMDAAATNEQPPTVFEEARISGLTIVQIPAFQESFISLGVDPDGPIAASADTDAFKRGSGWITHPEETKTLHHYWTRGEGALKIRWGTGGDFTRCTRQLKKYIEPRFLNRTCAQWHHDALGYWPGELGKPGNNPKTALDCDTPECEELAMIAASAAPALTLTAAAPPALVDASWFADPKFSAPTALVVDKAGRVFGHIAKWGTCHIGIEGQCVTPPTSKSNYANFHLGAVETTDGTMAVGALTLGTGHADLHMSATDTKHHYDHTGTMVANVRAGEDAHGIWVAGALCEGVTEDQRRTLMAAGGISGDWRSIGGSLELVAGLAVNVPGFPVPRPALAASGAAQESLVAAGVVIHEADPSIDAIADAVVEKLEAKQKRSERLAAMAPLTASLRSHRIAKLLQGRQ